jgi:AraC family transcriptional regulator
MSLTNKALFAIERNLDRDLSLAEIAEACSVSRFTLAHAFGEATGHSVMDYVRGRRLTEAAYVLAAGASDILTVALDAGYASHEAFTRAFGAQFGLTPEQVRRNESIRGLAIVEPARFVDQAAMKLAPPRFEKVGELKFVGLSERCSYSETQHIPSQWQRFMAGPYGEIENKAQPIPVGISTIGDDGADMRYVCAAEVTKFGTVPKGLVRLVLAPATYAIFAHDGHIATLQQTYVAIWNAWFAESGRIPAEAPGFERHNSDFDTRTGEGGVTVWIPLVD